MNRNLSVAVNWSVVGVDLRQFAGELARIQVAWLNMKWGSMVLVKKLVPFFKPFHLTSFSYAGKGSGPTINLFSS